jgi:hypothetical protein
MVGQLSRPADAHGPHEKSDVPPGQEPGVADFGLEVVLPRAVAQAIYEHHRRQLEHEASLSEQKVSRREGR